jgi:hypothetical protein
MVKHAEKLKKRSPWIPVAGAIIAVSLGVISWMVSANVVVKMPQVVANIPNSMMGTAKIVFAFGIWLGLIAFAIFLVAMLAGKDPESAKGIPLPPRGKDKNKHKY